MTDSDPEMRSAGYLAYAECFGASPELQKTWIKAFSAESDVDARKYILKALLEGNLCTPETLKFVIGELNDPAYSYDIGVSIMANVKPPPVEALPILVQKFAHSDDPGEREFLAQALALYGNRAET